MVKMKVESWRMAQWNTIGFKPHPGQINAFDVMTGFRQSWTCCPRQWGKTMFACYGIAWPEFMRMKEYAIVNEIGIAMWPPKILIITPISDTARLIFDPIYELAHKLNVPLKTDHNSDKSRELETTWGAVIRCMTAASPKSIVGHQWNIVIADEPADVDDADDIFKQRLRPTLITRKGKFIAIGTPGLPMSHDWEWKQMGLDDSNKTWGFYNGKPEENWYIPWYIKEIESQRQEGVPEDIILRQYYAQYVHRAGMVIPEYTEHIMSEGEEAEVRNSLYAKGKWHRAIDRGYAKPFACLIVAQLDDMLYVWDEYYQTGRDLNEHAIILKQQDDIYPFRKRGGINIVDPEDGGEAVRYFSNYRGHDNKRIFGSWIDNYEKGRIIPRVDAMRTLFGRKKIKISKRCKCFLEELAGWHYPSNKTGSEAEKPVKKDDHGPDALSYLTDYLFRDIYNFSKADFIRGGKLKSRTILKGYG